MSDRPPTGDVVQLLAISGSLRAESSNTFVLRAMARLAPPGITVTLYDRLGGLPPFNPDLDVEGAAPPAIVGDLRARIGRADGLLISSPEYAHGVPRVLKNALDWLVSSLEFPGKPLALVNVSARSLHARAQLIEILTTMSARIVEPASVTLPLDGKRLDAAAMCADAEIARVLGAALATLVGAIAAAREM
jgi:NAD(P)H-dependent FMN reductase